ncbi:MAG: LamG-like jellyroll fold domain-containing protein, partial [Verrucomicrobiota bacterium]|nr:LamG-like jellyroll fold domain-containing protein [Verrucomicrobiota bacterium]
MINQLRSTFFTGLMILLIVNAKSQTPTPIAYYDFEGDKENIVTDKSDQGNDAEVTSPGQTTLGINVGAPGGSSPATAAFFQNGLLNVPGIGLGNIINGTGSYTFTAWLKPSDLGGNKFLFGQTSQGIHNGIRNNGFLHQAHWGADTNGATNLNSYLAEDEDGWIHAAWTYDGGSDIGKIYLDGTVDWEGNKSAPKGSGNLIIGGSNGGGDGYHGLIDEIAIWDEVLSTEDIFTLAQGGASPIDLEGTDDDDDGLPDWWEDKNDIDDPGADPDQDGLTNEDEFQAGTDPHESDTDGDGFNDRTEIAAGSDPTNPNSVAGLPIPIAYYDFESKSVTTSDQSFNDNLATATDLVEFVDGGAPTGASPGSAAQLDGGHFRVPSIDMNSQIRDSGDGSYTMTAWIKPSALDGERFLFGQTNQGIHHGIRNNGFLHSAHWGADWNSDTNLGDYDPPENQNGWLHAAWVYAGATDTAKIYLDGVLDGTLSQRAPNGGGYLIIGARNNGESQYRGLVDEVAIWDKAISESEILKLAKGGSPVASLSDADEDGFI